MKTWRGRSRHELNCDWYEGQMRIPYVGWKPRVRFCNCISRNSNASQWEVEVGNYRLQLFRCLYCGCGNLTSTDNDWDMLSSCDYRGCGWFWLPAQPMLLQTIEGKRLAKDLSRSNGSSPEYQHLIIVQASRLFGSGSGLPSPNPIVVVARASSCVSWRYFRRNEDQTRQCYIRLPLHLKSRYCEHILRLECKLPNDSRYFV